MQALIQPLQIDYTYDITMDIMKFMQGTYSEPSQIRVHHHYQLHVGTSAAYYYLSHAVPDLATRHF